MVRYSVLINVNCPFEGLNIQRNYPVKNFLLKPGLTGKEIEIYAKSGYRWSFVQSVTGWDGCISVHCIF